LFIYQGEHPDPGYRQGMHEIAFWLLRALQMYVSIIWLYNCYDSSNYVEYY
jgi:hypothetical protein